MYCASRHCQPADHKFETKLINYMTHPNSVVDVGNVLNDTDDDGLVQSISDKDSGTPRWRAKELLERCVGQSRCEETRLPRWSRDISS